jgi:hypothetical protein
LGERAREGKGRRKRSRKKERQRKQEGLKRRIIRIKDPKKARSESGV